MTTTATKTATESMPTKQAAQARLEETAATLQSVYTRKARAERARTVRDLPADERRAVILDEPDLKELELSEMAHAVARSALDSAHEAERQVSDDRYMTKVKVAAPRVLRDLNALIEKHAEFAAESQAHFDRVNGRQMITDRFDHPLTQLRQIADVYAETLKSYGIEV